MKYQSINPATKEILKSYELISDEELIQKLDLAQKVFCEWEALSVKERANYFVNVAKLLEEELEMHSTLITIEMGKPITEARAEVKKCIRLCNYYIENAESLLKEEHISSDAKESYLSFEPMGIIYAVMPWNFPYWQVFRFLVPNLILGNAGLLKHASNVPQCAEAMEEVLLKAGIRRGVFQNLFINYEQSEKVIQNFNVRGVTLTGSNQAGSRVAELAGKYMKKSVLELGGSDPLIVLEDADLQKAAEKGTLSRMRNAGQSCIAAKRFIVVEEVYNEFLQIFTERVRSLKIGDPLDNSTEIGPLAKENFLEDLVLQVEKSVEMGARIVCGGKRIAEDSLIYEPTILVDVKSGMPTYDEEVFGPVAVVFKVENIESAIELANDTPFGLGAAVWTEDIKKAKYISRRIQTGTVAINGIVKSEPGLPFGGVKDSGYGRELSELGIREFANIKTINVF